MSIFGYNLIVDIRVGLIIERADISLGGAERSVFELMPALSAAGLQVEIIAAKGKTESGNIHILCSNQQGKRTSLSTFSRALKKHLSDNHYDIVHSVLPFDFADVYQPRGGSVTETIIRNAASYQSDFLRTYKKLTALANRRRAALLRWERKLCKNPRGPMLAALSRYVARQFRKHYQLDDERIAIIPNGIRLRQKIDTARTDKLRSQILNKLNLRETDNPVFFLFAANNFRLKGLAPLIEAVAQAESEGNTRAYFIIAGAGRTGRYRRLSKRYGIENRLVFLGPVRSLQSVLSISNIAILPTFYDPSSRFILEALSACKPVITTGFNGASEMIVDSRHGKIIESAEDISSLCEAINFYSKEDNIQSASSAISEDGFREKISINRAAEQLKSLYSSILEKGKAKWHS